MGMLCRLWEISPNTSGGRKSDESPPPMALDLSLKLGSTCLVRRSGAACCGGLEPCGQQSAEQVLEGGGSELWGSPGSCSAMLLPSQR